MTTTDLRHDVIEDLYQGLSLFVRRSRTSGNELHDGLSIVEYTVLVQIDANPDTRAADLAELFGLDKSTVSRQIKPLIERGLVRKTKERAGRRGIVLELTPKGARTLAGAAESIRRLLTGWLDDWPLNEIEMFTAFVARLNAQIEDRFG